MRAVTDTSKFDFLGHVLERVSEALSLKDAYRRLLAALNETTAAHAGIAGTVDPILRTFQPIAVEGPFPPLAGPVALASDIGQVLSEGTTAKPSDRVLASGAKVAYNFPLALLDDAPMIGLVRLEWKSWNPVMAGVVAVLARVCRKISPMMRHFQHLEEIDAERRELLESDPARESIDFRLDGVADVLQSAAEIAAGLTGAKIVIARPGDAEPAAIAMRAPIVLDGERVASILVEGPVPLDEAAAGRIAHLAELAAVHLRKRRIYEESLAEDRAHPIELIGVTADVMKLAEKAARCAFPVLVRGETGSGKEMVARLIHRTSPRRGHPFVAVNCSELTHGLSASELFGHVKGAFTGAVGAKQGVFQKAAGGTLLLDEIDKLDRPVQGMLLRAIERGDISPVGSQGSPLRVDVRVIACTNRDLEALVAEEKFLEDLYRRLDVIQISLKPLRHRRAYIPRIAAHLLLRLGKADVEIAPRAMHTLGSYEYPGNLRELRTVIEYALVHDEDGRIDLNDLPEKLSRPASSAALPKPQLDWDEFERGYLIHLLTASAGNVSKATELSGLSRKTLYNIAHRHGINLDAFRVGKSETPSAPSV